jgi:signal transduction histidine kinase
LATIELYDPSGKLLQKLGPHPIEKLLLHSHAEPCLEWKSVDGHNMRVGARYLEDAHSKNKIVGYLQVAVPTAMRDRSVKMFALCMVPLMPACLLILAFAGYIFSERASLPVETASALLRQFLADAGHELKTPIQAIQLTAENVQEEWSEGKLSKEMETITRATQRMTRLVDDMLLLAKYELQQLPMSQTQVRIDELLKDLIEDFRYGYDEKEIELELLPPQVATVTGDSQLLQRLFSNLLQNALRYTDSLGKVTVAMSVTDGYVKVTVVDTGIGIPPESIAKIFDRFYRTDKSRSRAAGGSGLGLSIAQAICQMHNGSLTAQSELGKGSTFQVSLPIR